MAVLNGYFFQATEAELGSFSSDDIKDFSPAQVVEFLAQLVDKVTSRLKTLVYSYAVID